MGDKHYVGETGTELLVRCGRDLTNAASLKIVVKRPDESVAEWTGTIAPQNKTTIRYILKPGDFSVPGEYHIQSKVDLNGWIGKGKTAKFLVYDRFE